VGLAEQKRIAEKLDTLLARVDACRERLDRVPTLIKRFKQSVLRAATSGKLTEDWRGGKEIEWTFERATDVCAKVQSGGTPKEGFIDSPGIPFLKVYNIVDQQVAFNYKPQFVSAASHARALSKSVTLPGDVLMNIVGPPLGKVGVVPFDHPEWNINQAITLFRPSDRISTGWLYCILCGGSNIEEIVNETRGSAGQTNISLSQCRDFVFPVPSIEEQTELVRRVGKLFTIADRLQAKFENASNQVERLTPSLLAKAFRGELVPQDPNDESAQKLLERLKATKSAAPPKASPRGRKRTATT
jgi:type I restriction enzyme S subunit